jgi:hypothetical protein
MHARLYFVPTHRHLELRNLAGFVREVEYMRSAFDADVPLLVLDDLDDAENLRRIRSLESGIPVRYMPRRAVIEAYKLILARLGQDDRAAMAQLWPFGPINFGNAMNKGFVLAMMVGASFLHRRDGDVRVEVATPDGRTVFPAEVEVRHLGVNAKDGARVVGGSYRGRWSIDTDILVRGDDYSGLRALLRCLSVPEEEHQRIIARELIQNNAPFEQDFIERNGFIEPEPGSIGYHDVFRWLPCSTAEWTGATDYFAVGVLNAVRAPVLLHNRHVTHAYTPCRYDSYSKVRNYWFVLYHLVDYHYVYRPAYGRLAASLAARVDSDMQTVVTGIVEELQCGLEAAKAERPQRAWRLSELEDILRQYGSSIHEDIANELVGLRAELLDRTEREIRKHVRLLSAWDAIRAAAEDAGRTADFQSLWDAVKC